MPWGTVAFVYSKNACNQSLKKLVGFLVCCVKHIQVPCSGGLESCLGFGFLRDSWGHMIFPEESHTFMPLPYLIMVVLFLRFILSLASCKKCLIIDDQLSILPISSHAASIEALPPQAPVSQLGLGESG